MDTTQPSRDIPVADISPISNIRTAEGTVEDLVESLKVQGQLEPVLVRPAAEGAEHGRAYELVFGYRRFAAATELGWDTIRAEVRAVPDETILDVMITENLQRENLSPIAEARAIKALIERTGVSRSEVARRLGVSPSQITRRLDLLGLAAPVVALVDRGDVPPSHAEALTALPAAEQERLAERVKRDGVSVRRLEGWVREIQEEAEAPAPQAPQALDPVRATDAVTLPAATLREDLAPSEWERLVTFILLRNGMDTEMLDSLREEQGIEYERLWGYVRTLSDEDVTALWKRLARRWVESAHRFPSLEPELLQDITTSAAAALPEADVFEADEVEVIDFDEEEWGEEWEADLAGRDAA